MNYPLLNVFLTMMWVFLWVMWIFLLIRVALDIFRSDDMGGFAKTFWLIFILVLPYLGVLIYVIARGRGMGKRDVARAKQAEDDFRKYVQQATGTTNNVADQLSQLAALRDRGVITEEEFARQKAVVLV